METRQAAAGSARVEQVLECAARLFMEKGYDGTSMRDIAAAVDVRPSSLYHHFPGKQQILFAICHDFQRRFNREVMPHLDAARPPEEAVRAAIREHVLHSHRHRLEVLVTVRERRSLPVDERDRITALRRQYRDALAAVIETGSRRGVFSAPDSKLAAMAILDMVNGTGYWFKPASEAEVTTMADRYAAAAIALLRGWSAG